MNDINIDTSLLDECGRDIVSLSGEINTVIEDIFTSFETISKNDSAWVGVSADKFIENSKQDKINYVEFNNGIRDMGKQLIDYAQTVNNFITKVRR